MKKKIIPALIAVALVAAGGIGFYAGQQSQPEQTEQPYQAESQQIVSHEPPATENVNKTEESQEDQIKFIEVTEEMKLAKFEEVYQAFVDRDDLGDERIFHEMCMLEDYYRSCGYTGDAVYGPSFEYQTWRDSYHPDEIDDTSKTEVSTPQEAVKNEIETPKVENKKPSENKGNNTNNTNNTEETTKPSAPVVDPALGGFIKQGSDIDSAYEDFSGGSTIDYKDYDPNWKIG